MKSINLLLSIKLLLVTAFFLVINSAYGVQYKFVAMDNSKETKMCVQAGSNDIKELKKAVKRESAWSSYKSSRRSLANTVLCNNLHIA